MEDRFSHAESLPSSPKGERLRLIRWLRLPAIRAVFESGVSEMPEVLIRNPADQVLISQIHVDAVTLITAEEVAQQHAPWSSLTGDCPETLARRHELERWHEQLKGDIALYLELRDEIETMSPDDVSRIERSGQRMIAALWKLIG